MGSHTILIEPIDSSSCSIFEAFSSSLEWISINLLSASSVLHILDDFLFIAPSKAQCECDLANFVSLCAYLGLPLAPQKNSRTRYNVTICWYHFRF